jgi:hypothetical protein
MEDSQHLKLTLTDHDGVVVATWTIGNQLEPEFDMEDLKSDTKHDFYVDKTWQDFADIGEEIMSEAEKKFFNPVNPNKRSG